MVSILVPIFVCVILPISIVLIVFLTKMNKDNKRAQILIKAIESNPDLDVDKLAESLQTPVRTASELLNLRLLRGLIFSLCGLMLFIVGTWAYCADYEMTDDAYVPLLFGGISLAVGLSYLIVYCITRKQIIGSSEDRNESLSVYFRSKGHTKSVQTLSCGPLLRRFAACRRHCSGVLSESLYVV